MSRIGMVFVFLGSISDYWFLLYLFVTDIFMYLADVSFEQNFQIE